MRAPPARSSGRGRRVDRGLLPVSLPQPRARGARRGACARRIPDVTVAPRTEVAPRVPRVRADVDHRPRRLHPAAVRPLPRRLEARLRGEGFGGRFLIMRSAAASMRRAAAQARPLRRCSPGPPAASSAPPARRAARPARPASRRHGRHALRHRASSTTAARRRRRAARSACPLRVPIVDILTVGAGGGSIAWIDAGGVPQRRPAQRRRRRPGRSCYGRGGTEPTVTDAAVVPRLHRPGALPGRRDARSTPRPRARGARERRRRAARDRVEEAAAGIVDVAAARMAARSRQITIERGHDPRDSPCSPTAARGPLLAPLLAREMGIREVIVPAAPGASRRGGC